MNKTTIKKKNKPHKNSIQYRKLRRWVLPALLGAALSTLAIIPTLAADTQSTVNGNRTSDNTTGSNQYTAQRSTTR